MSTSPNDNCSKNSQPSKRVRLNSEETDLISSSTNNTALSNTVNNMIISETTSMENVDTLNNIAVDASNCNNWKMHERDVGITEFIDSSIPGFSGLIKER